MSLSFAVAAGIRWIGFVALAALVGGLAVDLIAQPSAMRALDAARRRLRGVTAVCFAVLLATSAGELVSRAMTMAGGGWLAAVTAVPTVLTKTHFGGVWIARLALLAVGLMLAGGGSAPVRAASLVLASAVALTTVLTGHAADRGDVTVAIGLDWIHVVASTAWTGGLMALAMLAPNARAWPAEGLEGCLRRFSRLAACCVAAVVVTGFYNAWAQLRTPSALLTTAYGRVLAAKLLLVLGLLWLGALNRYTVVPALATRPSTPASSWIARRAFRPGPLDETAARSRLATYVAREALISVAVFACTALLTESTPARHAAHDHHHGAGAASP